MNPNPRYRPAARGKPVSAEALASKVLKPVGWAKILSPKGVVQ